MTTEKVLKDLNQEVYKVDPNYKDNGNKINYTNKEDNQLGKNERNIVRIPGEGEFKVLSVKDSDYGFQGMAVAPIVNGTPDYTLK